MIAAGSLEHVGHQLGGDGSARFILLVLAGIRKVGDDGGDATGGGGFASIDDDEEFHQAIVDVTWRSGLENED